MNLLLKYFARSECQKQPEKQDCRNLGGVYFRGHQHPHSCRKGNLGRLSKVRKLRPLPAGSDRA